MTTAQRNQLASLMDWLYLHREQVHYPLNDVRTETVSGIRSLSDVHALVLREQGWTVDCSQICEAMLRAVGAKLPFANGFTGSFLEHLPHYTDPRKAYVGGLAVFGPGTGHHMAMVRHRDTLHGNPEMFSHGGETDPRMIPLLTEAAFQPAPVTMVSIAAL